MDKALKKIFMNTHCNSAELFYDCYGEVNGAKVQHEFNRIVKNRKQPELDENMLIEIEAVELQRLKE